MIRVIPFAAATLALFASLAVATSAAGSQRVHVHLTDGDQHLSREHDLRFRRNPGAADVTIDVRPHAERQPIRGFGAAFTDSSAWLLSRLPANTRRHVMRKLFDPRRGIGLSVMRVPMGASDFTRSGMYSYDDVAAGRRDPKLRRFSIHHDRDYILPIIRQALRINPRIRIIANPWSPPAWMKTNDSMLGVSASGPGRLRENAYRPLAQYFVRFVKAYRRAGVPIWAVTPQNEPLQPTADYPGMLLAPSEEQELIVEHIARALRDAHLSTRVLGYDYTWLQAKPYVDALLGGPNGADARSAIDGIAYHCYFGSPDTMGALHDAYPREEAIEDECSTGISVLSPIQVLIRSVDNWATTVLMWNVALNPGGGPKIGSGCSRCIGVTTVDPDTGEVRYTGDYFQLGQASRFVRRGAHRIAASDHPDQDGCGNDPVCGIEFAAFRNPNGKKVVVVSNSGQEARFAIRRPDGRAVTYSLRSQGPPPDGTDNSEDAAVATFVWGGG